MSGVSIFWPEEPIVLQLVKRRVLCQTCRHHIVPGELLRVWPKSKLTEHVDCPKPWTPVVIEGDAQSDGQLDGQLRLPWLDLVDRERS